MRSRYCPLVLDLSWRDLVVALLACLPGRSTPDPTQEWPGAEGERALATMCVRSSFDLFLQAWAPPAGEVLVGAITHPDIARILQHHGLVPVPIDLDPETLQLDPDALNKAYNERTRALLVTHLFGGRTSLESLLPWCAERRLVLLEDCAQAFVGQSYRGCPQALLSMFSFGPLKTSTALGGGVAWVRGARLYEKMKELQSRYPIQSTPEFLIRIAKCASLIAADPPPVYALISWLLEKLGSSSLSLIRQVAAGYPGAVRVERFRRQPGPPWLRMLAYRLRSHCPEKVDIRRRAGKLFAAMIPHVARPGCRQQDPTHWIFPVTTAHPEKTLRVLDENGFEAMPGLSNLVCLPVPDRPELRPLRAEKILRQALILPIRPSIPPAALNRMGRILESDALKPELMAPCLGDKKPGAIQQARAESEQTQG